MKSSYSTFLSSVAIGQICDALLLTYLSIWALALSNDALAPSLVLSVSSIARSLLFLPAGRICDNHPPKIIFTTISLIRLLAFFGYFAVTVLFQQNLISILIASAVLGGIEAHYATSSQAVVIQSSAHQGIANLQRRYLTAQKAAAAKARKEKLEEIASAMEKTAKEAGVKIVAGDTKVAGKGQVDGVFITTTGIGEIQEGVETSGFMAKPGDAVIVSGDIGRHGCTILLAREDFGIDADVTSDCAPLWGTVQDILSVTKDVHVIRDATRGGVGTVLYEIAEQSHTGIRLNAEAIPVQESVKGVCGMLGLEPLYLACEGRLVIFAPKENAEAIVAKLREGKYSTEAAIIGEVTEEMPGRVVVTTEIGAETLLPPPGGELLPRIC